jgi:hypothetical protein
MMLGGGGSFVKEDGMIWDIIHQLLINVVAGLIVSGLIAFLNRWWLRRKSENLK